MKDKFKPVNPTFISDTLFASINNIEKMAIQQAYLSQAIDKEYVVEGSIVGCQYGSKLTKLGVIKDHAVYDSNGNAIMTVYDCIAGENVYDFGICSSPFLNSITKAIGSKCQLNLTPRWQGNDAHTYIWDIVKQAYVPVLVQNECLTCSYALGIVTVREVNSAGLSKKELFLFLDSYLQGNITDSIADKVLKKIAGNRTLDLYTRTDIKNINNYQRYDYYIIGWTDYYNDRFFQNGTMIIDEEYIKAIMWMESQMGYYPNSSPNKNVAADVMQVLDPRNPTIYEFCTYNLDTSKNVKILDVNNKYDLPVNIDKSYNNKKTRTKYNTPVADRLFKLQGSYYYYQYNETSPLLSIALGVKTYAIKLQEQKGNALLAAQEYNGSSGYKVTYKNNVDDLVNHRGNMNAQNYHT